MSQTVIRSTVIRVGGVTGSTYRVEKGSRLGLRNVEMSSSHGFDSKEESTITLSQSKFHEIRKHHQPSIRTDIPKTSYKEYVSVTNSSMLQDQRALRS